MMKLILCICLLHLVSPLSGQATWKNPIVKQGRLGSPLVETSPFVFHDKLYLLENNQRFWDIPGGKPGENFHDDEVRIRDIASNKIVSVALKNHGFGTVLTWNGRVYVFAGNYGYNKPWRHITSISMTSSADLKSWTKPVTILQASGNEFFFNTAVCRGKDKFVLICENNDPRWKPFTFSYLESADLKNWKTIPGAIYGKDKYVGGPALYYEGGYYYTLYLEALKKGFETRITRSRDLVNWEDAPESRPLVTFDPTHKNILLLGPDVSESNASDVELCYYKGKTILYFTGSDQTTAGDLQWATYDGTPRQLFEYFFKEDSDAFTYNKSRADTDYVPTPWQLAYQERQLGAFIHFGPATYLNSDMLSVPDPAIFDPEKLDAEQWVRTAKSFGAKTVILTAKHHNGFCLWPTKTTDYSVKSSPWKNGRGDVVAEFVAACHKYGMNVGLYVSLGDKHFGCTSTPDPMGKRKLVGNRDAYFPVLLGQIRELLTNYGKISEIWFDGAYDPFGWDVMDAAAMKKLGTAMGDSIHALVKALQPDAVVMGGTRPDIRWSGSEQGWAAYPLWNVVKPEDWAVNYIGPYNKGWIPAEANIHTRNSWFWRPGLDKELRSISFLTKVYYESIGRGANLLINMTPDTSGLIPEAEVKRLQEFGKLIQSTFSDPLGETDNTGKHTATLEIPLKQKQTVSLLVMKEDIQYGQHIRQYKAEALVDGKWKTIAEGQSIGVKRIQPIDPVETSRVRLTLFSEGGEPMIKKFAVYRNDPLKKDI